MNPPWIVAFGALTCAVVVLSILYVGLLRRISSVLEKAEDALARNAGLAPDHGLRTGDQVAAAEARDVAGRLVDLAELIARRRTVVLLAAPDCDPCERLLEALCTRGWPDPSRQLIVVLDEPMSTKDSLLTAAGALVLYQGPELSVSRALHSNIFPHAFAFAGNRISAPATIPATVDDLVRLDEVEIVNHRHQPGLKFVAQ
jgi:hypothetical protein